MMIHYNTVLERHENISYLVTYFWNTCQNNQKLLNF